MSCDRSRSVTIVQAFGLAGMGLYVFIDGSFDTIMCGENLYCYGPFEPNLTEFLDKLDENEVPWRMKTITLKSPNYS